MGLDTKAIIRRGVTIQEIATVLKEKYTEVEVRETSMEDFMYITFKDGVDQRQLAVSFTDSCERDDGITGVWLSLGMWGNSVEILRYVCETFGGYLDENDCDDEPYYPINFHLYEQGKEFTELDKFKNKVITKLGFEKLNTVMGLFEEFKTIKIEE